VIIICVVGPTIVPNSKETFEGEQAQETSIRCSARGKPDPKYMFFKVLYFTLFSLCLRLSIMYELELLEVVTSGHL